MTTKHETPEWRRTARTIKAQVKAAHARGEEITCWRCGRPLPVVETDTGRSRVVHDVGHLDPNGPDTVENAAPEHTRCNRSHGGRIGAQLTNARRTTTTSSFRPLAWA